MSRIYIHLPQKLLLQSPPGGAGFYSRLSEALRGAGYTVTFERRTSLPAGPEYRADGFHVVHQGLVQQQNVLNTGVAYIYPFWYADPKGVFGESSIADKLFSTAAVDQHVAGQFLARQKKRLIGRRISKYPQPDGPQVLPGHSIAVFLQGPSLPVMRAQFMSEIDMIDAILHGSDARPVLIKPHPRNDDPATIAHLSKISKNWPNLRVVDANVHDMLAVADVTCSVSSSVSLEGFVHEKPAIMFGRTDFHHIAETVEKPSGFPAALDKSLERDRPLPFGEYLQWFLQENCINMGRDDWFGRIAKAMRRVALV